MVHRLRTESDELPMVLWSMKTENGGNQKSRPDFKGSNELFPSLSLLDRDVQILMLNPDCYGKPKISIRRYLVLILCMSLCFNSRNEGIVSWNPASGDELEVDLHFCLWAASVPKEDKVVAAILDVAISGSHGSTPRYYSKRHGSNDATILPLSPDERERKVATLAEGKRKVGAHQRPLTLDTGANRNGSEGEGVSNKIEDTAGIVNVANGFAREHAAEGWASWLVSVAGEAVKGWLPRKANSFEKLNKA